VSIHLGLRSIDNELVNLNGRSVVVEAVFESRATFPQAPFRGHLRDVSSIDPT
jgi:hypothetical protein